MHLFELFCVSEEKTQLCRGEALTQHLLHDMPIPPRRTPAKHRSSATRLPPYLTPRRLGLLLFTLSLSSFLLGRFTAAPDSTHTQTNPTSGDQQTSFIPQQDIFSTAATTIVLFFTTGRSGTQHCSRVFTALPSPYPRSYITHEEEHISLRTRDVIRREYRPFVSQPSEALFNTSVARYVKHHKLPFYHMLLRRHAATRLVYTGHVPTAFGTIPAIVNAMPVGSVRVIRIRRDRLQTAASLMALGPEEQDSWMGGPVTDRTNRRWFPTPWDAHTRLKVRMDVWERLNRFQRYLWYVDDVECRWQAFLNEFGDHVAWMEDSLEALSVFDGGSGWRRVAAFAGVDVKVEQIGVRDNSIQHKQKVKTVGEAEMRLWDMEYRRAIGRCYIASDRSTSYSWAETSAAS